MSGDACREMNVAEELEWLKETKAVESATIDRILRKLYDETCCNKEREYQYRKELEAKIEEKDAIISGLAGYIRMQKVRGVF